MDVEVDKENTTTFLKRIVALARAILIRPEIIIAEEDSFVTSNDFGQVSRVLDTCLPILAKSTILCKITSFNLLDRFTKCAIFDDKTVTRFCTTQDLLSDVNSDNKRQDSPLLPPHRQPFPNSDSLLGQFQPPSKLNE